MVLISDQEVRMDENLRYRKDKATVIAIVKYILYLSITAVVLYFASKVLVIIFPFLIGFVLAKASRHISNSIIHFQAFLSCRFAGRRKKDPSACAADLESKADEEIPVRVPKKRSKLFTILFPQKKKKPLSKRSRIAVVIYVILLVISLAALITAATALVIQAKKIINNFPSWITQSDYVGLVVNWISQFSTANGGFLSTEQLVSITEYINNIKVSVTNMLPGMVTSILTGVITMVGDIPMLLFSVIVIIMSGFYFLTDSKMVFEFLSRNIKSRTFRHKAIHLVDDLSTTLFRVLGGYLALLIITFFEALIIFWIAGINYAVILALVTAVLDFMPVLGVSATMVPMMIYLAIQGDYKGIVILLIGMAVITVVRRFIEPPILGNAMHMHPLATLFAMIFGVAIWGAIGFLMGPVVFLIVIEAVKGFSLDRKIRETVGNILNKFSQ